MPRGIPQEDVKLINDAFGIKTPLPTISKDALGRIIRPKTVIVNPQGYAIRSFMGRTLKHNKWVIPKGGRQTLVAKKGQKYDDIPLESRKKVRWNESDFL